MKNVYVAGHNGMVGSAIVRQLRDQTGINIITCTRKDLDLTDQTSVLDFFLGREINEVYIAAAHVGGIHANSKYPADFIYQNLMIECNLINAAYKSGVEKLLFLGSSCIYPRAAVQPIREAALLTGPLESTNEPYAIAKIAGIKLCESYNRQYGCDFRSVMPTNLYGPHDNFHPENSHVIPALLRRFDEAARNNVKKITVWGSGKPKREFLHVDDMAVASLHVMGIDKAVYEKSTEPMLSHLNVGSGIDFSIKYLAETIAGITGFDGKIEWDKSKPDGPPRKLMDVGRMKKIGWTYNYSLEEGLKSTYRWYLDNQKILRG